MSFISLAFQNVLKDRNIDMKTLHSDDPSTSCENLLNFSPVAQPTVSKHWRQ